MNLISETFEHFLRELTGAGAKLIFVFKKISIIFESDWIDSRNKEYCESLKFLKLLEEKTTGELLDHFALWYNRQYPLNPVVTNVLCQVAAKYGSFHGNDIFLSKETAGHVELANNEKAYAIMGLDTYYLCYEGAWKFWSPQISKTPEQDIFFEAYDKQAVLDYHHFDSFEQMQLFALLAGELKTTLSNESVSIKPSYTFNHVLIKLFLDKLQTIENFFQPNKVSRAERLKKVFSYVGSVPLPFTRETYRTIVGEIFGEVDESIVDNFVSSMQSFKCSVAQDSKRFPDDEVGRLIKDKPMSIAESILHQRDLTISSNYLDLTATDMKSGKELTLPLWTRTMGLLLQHVDGDTSRYFIAPVDDSLWEKTEIDPDFPLFKAPLLKNLVTGNYDKSMKSKILLFLVGEALTDEFLKKVPKEYLVHFILLNLLVQVLCEFSTIKRFNSWRTFSPTERLGNSQRSPCHDPNNR